MRKIQTQYEEFGYTIDFLELFFDAIHASKPGETENGDIAFHVKNDNQYFCNIISATCSLNNYSCSYEVTSDCRDTVQALFSIQEKKKRYYLRFAQAIETVGEENLILCTKWFESQINFALSYLGKIRNDGVGNKRKVASILEEL